MKNSLLCKCQALFATHSNKKNTTRFNGLLALFLVVIGMNGVVGQVAQFNFPSTNSLVVSTNDANVTVSNLSLSVGTIETNITTGSYFPNEPYIEESGGWTATSQDLAKSFTFTITASSGYIFSITNVSFRGYATGSGPTAFGFTIGSTDIYSVNAPDGSIVAVNQSVSNQTGLTTATIKIKGWLNGSRTSSGAGAFRLDDLIINGSVSSVGGPNITQTGLLNTFISSAVSSPSAEQTFTIAGTTLTNDIVITAPTGYQVSTTSGSGFGSSVTLTQSSGTVATTTIYARFNPTALADQVGGNIAITTTGATTQNVAVSGEVTNLSAGAIAFVAFQGAAPDVYRIVALNDIPNNTRIWFTDKSWDGGTLSFFSGEGNNVWTNTTGSAIAAGTVIQFDALGAATLGTGGLNSGLGSTGEQLFAYQGTLTSPTFVAGYTSGTVITTGATTGTSTYVPVGLTSGTNFVALGGTYGSSYVTAAIHNRSLADMRSHIHNFANLTTTISTTTSNSSWPTYTFNISNIWTGASSTDWNDAANWNPLGVPTDNVIIPTTGITNFPVATSLTIDAGKTVTLNSNSNLTVNGTLTNNGILSIESGATLVQEATSSLAGSGTYNVKQAVTGATDGTIPNGRFWYLGSPVSGASSSVYFASNAANVLKWRNEATNSWTTVASGTPENLEVGKGYYTQAMGNATVNFTGDLLNNGAIPIVGLTRTAGQGFEGFNLVSNPYPSYLDWDLVTKTNVGNTMWYRTASGSTAGSMVFDTYVAGTGGIGTNLNVAGGVSNLVPPMQSFWVRVNYGSTTGSLGLSNSMREHFTSINGSVAGLKSTSNERDLFLRMNLLQANKKDQLIVYVNETATNGFDQFDGEKMMQAGMPQFYTSAAGKKITINGLNSAKKQQALPITMELPTTGVHSFVIEDLEIDNGLVWLEDKQEEIMQALEPGTVYEFYANSGINAERFVLHFQLIDNTTPINVYNEVNGSANFSGKGASVHAESAGVVVIKLPATTEGVTDIQIRDAAGRLVYTGATNTLETSVQLEQANGIYYVTLNGTSGVEVRKVFIQQ